MNRSINKAAVLGAGVMGATIAAQLVNVVIPTCLLDIGLETSVLNSTDNQFQAPTRVTEHMGH